MAFFPILSILSRQINKNLHACRPKRPLRTKKELPLSQDKNSSSSLLNYYLTACLVQRQCGCFQSVGTAIVHRQIKDVLAVTDHLLDSGALFQDPCAISCCLARLAVRVRAGAVSMLMSRLTLAGVAGCDLTLLSAVMSSVVAAMRISCRRDQKRRCQSQGDQFRFHKYCLPHYVSLLPLYHTTILLVNKVFFIFLTTSRDPCNNSSRLWYT